MKKFLMTAVVVNPQNWVGFFNIVRGMIFLISLSPLNSLATEHDSLRIKASYFENRFDDPRALSFYRKILLRNPNDVDALIKTSRLYARIGGRKLKGASKKEDIRKAELYALRSIELAPHNVEARFNYIIAMGLLSEMAANPRAKLENARIIKRESDLVLALQPNHAGVHYVLGKWHQSISALSWMERLACDALFGGVPEGASSQEAMRNFERAIELYPDFILFHIGLAKFLAEQKRHAESVDVLKRALSMRELEPDDIIRKENCRRLLFELQHNTITAKQ
jgi:regulator of microtubule dynamics protein 3